MTITGDQGHARLLRRGFVLEYLTLGWNVAGIIVWPSRRPRPGRSPWLGSAWTR